MLTLLSWTKIARTGMIPNPGVGGHSPSVEMLRQRASAE